jgi:hypothetical protein
MDGVPYPPGVVRVAVAGPAPCDRRGRHQRAPFEHALDAAEVLGRLVDLAPLPEEDDDLGARLALEVDVGRRADVLSPAVLGRGETPQDVRRLVAVEEGDHAERVGVGVGEGPIGELLTDQGPEGVGTARTVPLEDPMVEQRQEGGFERNPQTHDFDGHVHPLGRTAGVVR